MKNKFIVTSVDIEGYRITCNYIIEGDWGKYFSQSTNFWVEYNVPLNDLPKSLAIIPLISNILPIAWLNDAEIFLDEIDSDFFECIDNVKSGYKEMYPLLQFKGSIRQKSIVKNIYEVSKPAVLFSGGVDAFNTLLTHISEKPMLITLWGADIGVDNIDGWRNVSNHIKETTSQLNLSSYIVKSNFREFIVSSKLKELLKSNSKLNWWHDFQHGIGIIGHTSPLAFVLGIEKVYIASSFTSNDIGNYTCASDPIIDNQLRFGVTVVVHDGYEYNRQNKISRICQFGRENNLYIPLRVCWQAIDGRNCCNCEKCYRTMMGIIAEKENPVKFGFDVYNQNTRRIMLKQLNDKFRIEYNHRYIYIQKRLRENYDLSECPEDLKWFYNVKIKHQMPRFLELYFRAISKIKCIILGTK
jgi:hypothetical protein